MEQRAYRPRTIRGPGGNLGITRRWQRSARIEELESLKRCRSSWWFRRWCQPLLSDLSADSPELISVDRPEPRHRHPHRPSGQLEEAAGAGNDRRLLRVRHRRGNLRGQKRLAQMASGCEPASAATVAGIRKLVRAGKILAMRTWSPSSPAIN